MILQKLTMKNFRQFRGTQQIIFASPSKENERNVTVIFGKNGRGKTGIFRAIMFCLYGDHRLSQDAHVTEKELHLINAVELQNFASEDGRAVEAFVELEFSHKGSVYNLKRTILGMCDGSEIIEQKDKVFLIQRTEDGNAKKIDDPQDIERSVNSILDHRVREYFLFDGEKIERLTRANSEQRKEISRGLRNLLDIDTLETAIKATARLSKNLDAGLARRSTGEYAKLLNRLKEKSERLSRLKQRIEQIEKELELATV